jgi:hypothetical protein
MNSLKLTAKVLLFAFTLVPIWAHSQPITTASLLEQMGNVRNLPKFRNYTTHIHASTDPTGGNTDRGFYQKGDASVFPWNQIGANEHVLAHATGPGAIVRLWTTDAAAQTIRIYLDGKIIRRSFSEFFNGNFFGIKEPFSRITYGSTVSYQAIPMPFQDHMIVTIESSTPDPNLYYQVNHIKFPAGTEVQTYNENLSGSERQLLENVALAWKNPSVGRITNEYAASVPAYNPDSCRRGGCPATQIFNIGGTGQINALGIKVGADNPHLRNLVVRIYFDGHKDADIEAPLADFRGNPFQYRGRAVPRDGSTPPPPPQCGPLPQDPDPDPRPDLPRGGMAGNSPQSIFTKMGEDRETVYFMMPMPFFQSALMTIENGSGQVAFVTASLAFENKAGDDNFNPATTGYLRSQFFHERTKEGRVHPWMKNGGTRGHFMGVVQGYVDPLSGFGFLEGDEQFRTDNDQFKPVTTKWTTMAPWNGTGAEDYFNSGYYFHGRPSQRFCKPDETLPPAAFQQPTYGLLLKVYGLGAISTYKWHILDGPTWTSSIDAQMEHGANNNNPNTYFSSLAFWYSSNDPQRSKPIYRASDLEWPKRVNEHDVKSGSWFN